MQQTKENIIQEFFGKLFNTVNEFTDGVFNSEIEDKSALNSDEINEAIYKTKQSLINLTKDNLVKASSKEEFTKLTKKSFNEFVIKLPNNPSKSEINLLEVCSRNESLLNNYLLIFEIPEENFKDIKDAILSAEESKKTAEKAKDIKLEVKLTDEQQIQRKRAAKIMERVEALFKKFGEVFAKIFRSEGSVLADFGVVYKGKVEIEKSGQLTPTVGIAPSRGDKEKTYQ